MRLNKAFGTASLPLAVKWKAKTEGFVFDSPLAAGDRVFIGSRDGTYRCWALSDGSELWKHVLDPAGNKANRVFMKNYPIENGSAIVGQRVVVGDRCGYVRGLSLETGEVAWHRRLGYPICLAPPLVTQVGVVVAARNVDDWSRNDLYCLSSDDGNTQWQIPLVDRCVGLACCDDIGIAVQSRERAQVLAFKITTGEPVWKWDSAGELAVGALIHEGLVFVGIRGEAVIGLDVADGTERWRVGVQRVYSPLSTDGTCLFVPGGRLRAYDLATRGLVWASTENAAGYINSAACVAGEHVFIGGGHSRWVDALSRSTGEIAWRFQTKDMVFSTPIVVGNHLLVGSHDKYLYCFQSGASPG